MKRNLLISLLVLGLIAACGGTPTAAPLPTPTQIPTYSYVQPTLAAGIQAVADATEAVTEAASAVDPEAISQGQGRYVALKCADCHGENGQGDGDKGPTLVGLTLSQADFTAFMRSGGKLGTSHQYAANRLSANGVKNLYVYLQSLSS
ncbi:MAG: c-type cytochrome [Chloroflexota bacterium]